MTRKHIHRCIHATLLIVSTFLFQGCNDENETENEEAAKLKICADLSAQLDQKYAQLETALKDCSKMEELHNEIIDLLNEGTDCEEFQDLAEDAGFDSVEEYADHLAKSFQGYLLEFC